jgi:hypothetical protein
MGLHFRLRNPDTEHGFRVLTAVARSRRDAAFTFPTLPKPDATKGKRKTRPKAQRILAWDDDEVTSTAQQ